MTRFPKCIGDQAKITTLSSVSLYTLGLLLEGLQHPCPLLPLLECGGPQVPAAVPDTDVKPELIQLVLDDHRLIEADGAPTPKVCLTFGFVVDKAPILDRDKPLLPAVDVVCPLIESSTELGFFDIPIFLV